MDRTADASHRLIALGGGVLALAALCAGLRWGAMVAGGADSYGYVSQAGYWQRGSVVVQEDVIRPSPWPGAALTWSPLGYRPSPHRPDAIVPLYAPGLPLLMALGQLIAGFCGAFLVVPLCGALTIWLTYALGRRVFDAPGIALWGAAPRRDQPGVSLSADERDERRAGDRRVDARARAGGRAAAAGRRTRDERGDRHPAEPGAAGRCGDGVDGAARRRARAASAAPRPRALRFALGVVRLRDRHRACSTRASTNRR